MQYLDLLDYRRRVAAMYTLVRETDLGAEQTWKRFCVQRDELLATHPQSPLSDEQKQAFTGLRYFPYNVDYRFRVPIQEALDQMTQIELQDDGIVRMNRFGQVLLSLDSSERALSLYWILGYGGGVFLPFRDATAGKTTYGGGRYVLDTIKHADLGSNGGKVVIDFNYAYNPSCAYNSRWSCPLSPWENILPVEIPAGEMGFDQSLDRSRLGADPP